MTVVYIWAFSYASKRNFTFSTEEVDIDGDDGAVDDDGECLYFWNALKISAACDESVDLVTIFLQSEHVSDS